MSEVTEFLKHQTIFITGVTGFLGKVMLWKMLKEAGENVKIYAMVRASKDATIQKRIEELFSAKIFDDLLASNPRLKNNVIPVEGDITKDGFGMSLEDQERLHNEVTVIIHSAATTKFNEKIKLALDMNTFGVRRMLHLGRQCKKLISIVHISTCYVAADKPNGMHIQDKVYPTRLTPAEVFERIKNLSIDEAELVSEEIISPYPNTYSFTKALGEQVVVAERGNLPLCILRPSIVTGSWMEPLPGWIDVMFGPAGLFLAAGTGALKVMLGNANNVTDLIPVDTVCNAIIAAAWRNTKLAKEDPSFSNLTVYHIASSTENPIRWFDTQYLVPQYFVRHRPKRNFGYPGYARYVGSRPLYHVLNYALHFIPAVVMDGLRLLQGKKPFMYRASTKLNRAISALNHFTMNQWFFSSHSANAIIADMSEVDQKKYHMDIRELDWDIYLITFLHGIRKFLLKEEETTTKPGQKEAEQKQGGWWRTFTNNIRLYLLLISLGSLIYFFRQNFWLLKLRAKQIKGIVQNAFANMSTKALTASV